MDMELVHIIHAEEDADFDEIFKIREAVFETELGISEEAQIDGFDPIAHHYIVLHDGVAVGVSRWRVTLGGHIRLERLAVLPAYRHQGLGAMLMERMLADIPKSRRTFIECINHQKDYFGGFGFVAEGEEFETEGIPHIRMELRKPAIVT